MRKLLWTFALCLLFCSPLAAQNVTVNAQIHDPSGQYFSNGTFAFSFVPGPTGPKIGTGASVAPVSGSLDSTGSFSGVVLGSTAVLGGGARWKATICAATGGCFSILINVTLSQPNLSAVLSAAAPLISSLNTACAAMGALTGDTTSMMGTCATTTKGINNAVVPANLSSAGTNSLGQIVAGTGGNATTVNGASVPANSPCTGTNSSSQFVAGTCGATLPANTDPLAADSFGAAVASKIVVNIMNYGAKCDGTTDDSAAFAAAVAALPAEPEGSTYPTLNTVGGGILFIPASITPCNLVSANLKINKPHVKVSGYGASLLGTVSDDVIAIGDLTNINSTINDITIEGLALEPGVGSAGHSAIRDNAQGTRIVDVKDVYNYTGWPSHYGFNHFIENDDDFYQTIDSIQIGGGTLVCNAAFCGSYVWGPGPSATNAGITIIQGNSQISPEGSGNCVDWANGNSLHIVHLTCEGYNQFAVRAWSNISPYVNIDYLYDGGHGSAVNPLGNVGSAGVIALGGIVNYTSGQHGGEVPVFVHTGSGSGTNYQYYIVGKNVGGLVTDPMSAGYITNAAVGASDSIAVGWPHYGATSYTLLRQVGYGILTSAPYGTGNWRVALDLAASSACNANGLCTFTDNVVSPSSYTVTGNTGYNPSVTLWGGSVVLSNAASYKGNPLAQGGIFVTPGGSTATLSGGATSAYYQDPEPYSPITTQAIGMAPYGQAYTALLLNGILTGIKGGINMGQTIVGGFGAHDIITLNDSDLVKTRSTLNQHPSYDAQDSALSVDANYYLATRSQYGIAQYINSLPDGTSWLERLTASLKTFAVPVTFSNLATFNGGIAGGTLGNSTTVIDATAMAGATSDVKINAAVTALASGGGTVDARGFGATTQTIAATVNIGSNTKTVTFLFDRTTTWNCTITNNTPCFKKGPGSSMIGTGEVASPNAGLTFSASAAVSAGLFDQQQNGGNYVGGYVEGLMVSGNSTMTVSDALVSLQCPLQVTSYRNMIVGSFGLQNSILLKIYGTTACGAANVDFDNVYIDGMGAVGAKPVWIGCTSAGSTSLVACPEIADISFNGSASSYGHPGSGGIPIVDIECGNGSGGSNSCRDFNFNSIQIESSNTGDIGIFGNGVTGLHVYGLDATCHTNCGADVIRLSQPSGTVMDGIDLHGIDNGNGWTNTINNTLLSKTIPYATSARVNYVYSYSSRTFTNVWDDGSGNEATIDSKGLSTKAFATATNCSSSASPAVCGSAAAGSVVIAASATSVVVNTTAVTANSQILLTEDSSLGTKLTVTCNTQSLLTLGVPKVKARVGGTSFTASIEVGPTTNPMCLSYAIVN